MIRNLDFPPEVEDRLQRLAAQNGTSVEAVAVQELAARILSEDELDAMLDARDAQRLNERTPAEPSECYSLDDLRKAMGR